MKKSSNNGSFGKRVLAVFLIILVFPFLLSVANLFKIQTIDSEKYKSKAEQNQLRDTEISAERGIIYDANGTVLAQSASVWKLYINPSKITDENFKAEVCSKLAELTGVDEQDIADKAAKNKYNYLVIKTKNKRTLPPKAIRKSPVPQQLVQRKSFSSALIETALTVIYFIRDKFFIRS